MLVDPHEIFADNIRHLYQSPSRFFIQALLLGGLLVVFLSGEIWPPGLMLPWWLLLLGITGLHARLARRLTADAADMAERIHPGRHVAGMALLGLAWGAAGVYLPMLGPAQQLLLVAVLVAVAATSLTRIAALPRAYSLYLLGILLPTVMVLAVRDDPADWMTAGVLVVVGLLLFHEARLMHGDLLDLHHAHRSLLAQSWQDKLTGLPNRRRLDEVIELEWRRALRLRVPLSLIIIDIDQFKKYNDRYGHPAGDACLSAVAQALAHGPQRAGDLAARYGGEEFAIVLPHTSRDEGFALAEQLRKAVVALALPHEDSPRAIVTLSAGGATCIPEEGETVEALIRAADQALYRAKASGRDQVAWAPYPAPIQAGGSL